LVTGIKEIVIQPYTFHSRHIFSEDLNVSFTAYDFIGSSTSCSIQFIVVGEYKVQQQQRQQLVLFDGEKVWCAHCVCKTCFVHHHGWRFLRQFAFLFRK